MARNLRARDHSAEGTFDFWPRWSPDSRRVVITHVSGDQIQIVTINADGTNLVNLTPAGVLDFMPDWSRRSSQDNNDDQGAQKCRGA